MVMLVYAIEALVSIFGVGALVCIGLALFTEDAAGNAGCIEEGQVW